MRGLVRGNFLRAVRIWHVSDWIGNLCLQYVFARDLPHSNWRSLGFELYSLRCWDLRDRIRRDDMQSVLCRHLSVRVGDDELQPLPARYIPDRDRGSVSFEQPVCCWHVPDRIGRDGMRCVLCWDLPNWGRNDKLHPRNKRNSDLARINIKPVRSRDICYFIVAFLRFRQLHPVSCRQV